MYTDKEYFLTKINSDELDKLIGDSEDNLDSAISAADSLIDSYLMSVATTLPLADPPEVIKQASYDIATYHLHDRIQLVDIPERIKAKYDDTINWLKDVARGLANIPGIASEEKEEGINYDVNDPKMGRNSI